MTGRGVVRRKRRRRDGEVLLISPYTVALTRVTDYIRWSFRVEVIWKERESLMKQGNFIFYLLPSSWSMGGTKFLRNWLKRPMDGGLRDADERVPIWKNFRRYRICLQAASLSNISVPCGVHLYTPSGAVIEKFSVHRTFTSGLGLEFRALVYYSIISLNTKFLYSALCCFFETANRLRSCAKL